MMTKVLINRSTTMRLVTSAAIFFAMLLKGSDSIRVQNHPKQNVGKESEDDENGGSHRFPSVAGEQRSLLFNANGCNVASNKCTAILGTRGRRMYRNRSGCSNKCFPPWSVSFYRLFGWQCGTCASNNSSIPTSTPTSSPTSNPAGRICSATTTLTVTNYQQYDKVVLQGFGVNQVEWDVSYTSQGSKVEFNLPYSTITELSALQALVSGIANVGLDTSAGYETRLMIPDPKVAVQSCNPSNAKVRITVPRTANSICIGLDTCRQVICSLGGSNILDRNDFSFAPGNAEIFFGNNTECYIKKPPQWDEYVMKHFGNTTIDYNLYLYDTDGDGASNVIEYYGIFMLSLYADYANVTGLRRNLNITSTDPKKPDTDGDLLLDGYELFYGSDPLTFRSVSNDTDGDGLNDLQEQIFGTDLFRKDTDNDGVSDRVETSEGSNPLDDIDYFIWNRSSTRALQIGSIDACNPSSNSAKIRLSVGDSSGSQSERYRIIVDGWVSHESPEFGKVDSGDYTIPAGVYTVRVEHVASKLPTPDYDYSAAITSLESPLVWRVTINDTSRLLGTHSESTFDYTVGKSATLNVSRVLSAMNNNCERQKSCSTCRSDINCRWDDERKICKELCSFSTRQLYEPPDTCPCSKCEKWYDKEKDRSRQWIEDLPDCPCRVNVAQLPTSIPFYSRTQLIPIGSPYTWDEDWACNPESPNDCAYYHPGALGCIRTQAVGSTTGQQCCYDATGRIIKKGRGAGTPDLFAGVFGQIWDHLEADVNPFEDCCKECNEDDGCANYIGSDTKLGVRQETGDCAGTP